MAITLQEQDNGVTVYQVTENPGIKSNIYCEISWCSADSRYFVFDQQTGDGARNPSEYILCEFGTWKTERLGEGIRPTMSHTGIFYYRTRTENGVQELRCVDLATGVQDALWEFPEDFQPRGWVAVSRDERYLVYGTLVSYDPQHFTIERVDRQAGVTETLYEDPDIWNPHTQFEPGKGRSVLVQHNRGSQFGADGTRILRYGPEGNTIFILDVETGEVTRLQLGRPHTPGTTGHEAWIGDTGEILVSVHPDDDFTVEKGNLLAVGPDQPARVVSRGYHFLHVGTSVCGRFFSCDDRPTTDVVIGSIATGKTAVICCSETSFGAEQYTHPHPYLSPDLKWVVFSSDRSGEPQLHAARVPSDIVEGLAQA